MHSSIISGTAPPSHAGAPSPSRGGAPLVIAGKYTILGEIDHGGKGTVYKAYDGTLHRTVAIQRIAGARQGDPETNERFRRDARLAASLNHPNLITIHDFGEDAQGPYRVMEMLEGADLAAVLRRHELTSLEDKLDVIEQILEGVAFAHAQGLIHRDLIPANIYRSARGRIKILDFGLAFYREPQVPAADSMHCTPRYMPPEQMKGEDGDARCDVFALGAMIYEILTDRRCFQAPSAHPPIVQDFKHEPPPLSSHGPALSAVAERIIARAIAERPEDRYRDAGELQRAVGWLRRLLQGKVSESLAMSAACSPGTATGTAGSSSSDQRGVSS